ncbi:MAG: hypothetical protein ACJ75M_06600, partial [Actinomycetes bacterium]
MQRISTTVIGLVGERARACAEALDRAANIRVELPDPAAPPLDRAVAAWQVAAAQVPVPAQRLQHGLAGRRAVHPGHGLGVVELNHRPGGD